MGRSTASAARAAARCEHIEANEQKQRRKVEEHAADGAEHGGDGARRRARGDRERNVLLAQHLDQLRVAAREELHRAVLAPHKKRTQPSVSKGRYGDFEI